MHPAIIQRDQLHIAGISGDGNRTEAVWDAFRKVEKTLPHRASKYGYEIRIERDGWRLCHVGAQVSGDDVGGNFSVLVLPASEYAVFEVHVSKGYDSQNETVDEWLANNTLHYHQRMLDGFPYFVWYYDERFHRDEEHSVVDLWVPVECWSPTRTAPATANPAKGAGPDDDAEDLPT